MIYYIIILVVATIGVALVTFVEGLSKNKLIKYGAYLVYFILIELILYAVTDGIEIPAIILGAVIGIVAILLLVRGSYTISASSKIVKILISTVFIVLAILAGYKLYDNIMIPIRFDKEKVKRYQATVDELKRIRTAQIAYKNEYNFYTSSLDDLKKFIETDSMTVIRKLGEVPDTIYLQQGNNLIKAERECIRLGIPGFARDTIKQSIIDTLFKEYDLAQFGYVPYTDGLRFEMDTTSIDVGGLTINIFEAKISNLELLNGLNRQLILNLNDDAEKADKYEGLKVGSLKENNNNEGNWEKEYDLKK